MLQALKNNTTITTLKLLYYMTTDENLDVVATKLEYDILESLTIDIAHCDKRAYKILMTGLEKNTSLKYLRIISNYNLSTMCKILEKLQNKPYLKDIHIDFWYTNGPKIPKINKFIDLLRANKSIISVGSSAYCNNNTIRDLVTENLMENQEYKKRIGKKIKKAYH